MINDIADRTLTAWRQCGKTKSSASGWISGNAVCCTHNGETPDFRGRGGLKTSGNGQVSWHCFNCGFKASYQPGRHLSYKFRKLLSWLGVDENEIKRLVIEAIRIKDIYGEPKKSEEDDVFVPDYEPQPLPEDSVSLRHLMSTFSASDWTAHEHYLNALQYVTSRGIDLERYDFLVSNQRDYHLNQRVIVPFTWQNQVIGFTARDIYNTISPKYYSAYDSDYVFNVDQQRRSSQFVLVHEGPFDAMGVDGVAVLKAEISDNQADIIDSLGREVIVVPDFDKKVNNYGRTVWAGGRLVDAAIEYGWSVSFPIWAEECKDVNNAVAKYGKLFTVKSILDGKETSTLKIKLRKKLYD